MQLIASAFVYLMAISPLVDAYLQEPSAQLAVAIVIFTLVAVLIHRRISRHNNERGKHDRFA